MGSISTGNNTGLISGGRKGGCSCDGVGGFEVWDVLIKKKKIPLIHNKKKCSGAKTSTFLFLLHLKYKIKVTCFHI